MHQKIDPITLAVVRGVLETTQREMTMTLEKTARSSVFNVAHDYSNAIFNHRPEMILQGQDIPIHLGGLIPAMKAWPRISATTSTTATSFITTIRPTWAAISSIAACTSRCSTRANWCSGPSARAT